MDSDQMQSLYVALRSWLSDLRLCFKREKTWEYLYFYVLGLLADLKRKSIEPIALAAQVPVRTMQEFLSFFAWDHARLDRLLRQRAGAGSSSGCGDCCATGSACAAAPTTRR